MQWRWGWVVFVASFLNIMVADVCLSTTGLFLPAWREYFNCSMAEVSAISSVTVLFYHTGGLSGTIVNIVGYRAVVMFSGFMAALGICISSFVSSRILLGFTYGLMAGFFSGSNYPGCAVAVASYFSENYSLVWGLCSTGTALGIAVLPPLTQYLIDLYGWRGAMLLISGIVGHVVVCGMLLRPISITRRPLRRRSWHRSEDNHEAQTFIPDAKADYLGSPPDSKVHAIENDEWSNETDNDTVFDVYNQRLDHEKQHDERSEIESPKNMNVERTESEKKTFDHNYLISDRSDVVKVLDHKVNSNSSCTSICYTLGLPVLLHSFRVVLLVISQFTIGLCYNFVLSHLHASIVYRGVNSQTASVFVSLIGFGSIVGHIGHGFLVNFGCISAKNLYMVSMAFCGLCVVLYQVAEAYWIYVVLSFGIGVFSGTFFSLEVVLSRVYVGKEHMGRAIGLMFLSHGTGGFIGPVIGGWAYDVTGSYDYPFYISGGILLVSSLIFLLEPKLSDVEARRAAAKLHDRHASKTNATMQETSS